MAATRKKKGVAQKTEPQVEERTVSGVADPESQFNKDRLAQLEEISAKNSEDREKYAEYHGINPPEEEAPVAEAIEEEEEKEEVVAQEEEQEEDQPKERMVKIKVDGREQEVPESRILEEGRRALQKETAADKRLQEATELLRQAKEQFGQMSPSSQKPNRDLSKVDDLELARRIQMGTEDEAAEAVRIMRDRDTVSSDNVAALVENRVLAKLKFEEVRSEYSDVLKDPYLSQLAVMEDQRMIAEGDSRLPHERLPDIAKKLREWRGPRTTGKVVVGDLEQRRSAKAAAASIPSAHGKKPSAQSEQKPQTREQIIEEMRKARGQSL